MNLKQTLSSPYSKFTTQLIVNQIINNPKDLPQLLILLNDKDKHISGYAGWIISYVLEKKPQLIKNQLSKIIDSLEQSSNPSLIRNAFRTLQFVDIPEKFEGNVLSKSFEYLNNPKSAIAIKVFAMTVIFNISKKYPEIQNELKCSIENQFEEGSAGFKNRASKILNKLNS